MRNEHWTNEEFLARIYGIGPENGHLEECEPCRRRFEGFSERRSRLLAAEPEVRPEFLHAQRRSILARLGERPAHFRLSALPAMAVVLLFLVIATVFKPIPKQEPLEFTQDAQLYQDVFSMASSTSPSAVEPIQSLFEDLQ